MISLIPRRLKEGVRWITDSSYRRKQSELHQLRKEDRFEAGSTTLLGTPLEYVDAASLLSAYKAIFEDEIYAFESDTDSPRIVDGGANIGLATLYWKQEFPDARIIAFEPDPEIFETLKRNIEHHACDDVTLVEKGLWSEEGRLEFQPDGADGGQMASVAESEVDEESVPVTRLVPYLDERIDMLKLDIEGAEVEVLCDAAGHLGSVQNLFVEWHSYVGKKQRVDEILGVLRQAGFRIHIHPEFVSDRPFVQHLESYGMDHRLNIFAYRE
jgi:FkbM family methyltransferase